MKLKKYRFMSFFDDMFGFESKIDISNDCAVLFRRNVVIKNIIFLSNIVYTIILAILSIGEASNWVLTIIVFPLTFLINHTLKKTIYRNTNDFLKQQIAMYMACFYMFLSAIMLYLKLKTGSENSYLGEAGYILLYYALVVVSLYQDKKMLKTVFMYVLVIITLLHFTLTYNLIGEDDASNLFLFIKNFFTSNAGKDILLRTIILGTFMIVLYSIVAIGQYMQEERKKELIKRKQVQDDFTNVVIKMFNVTLNDTNYSEEKIKQAELLSIMSAKLASILGYNQTLSEEIGNYAKIQHTEHVDLDITNIGDKDEQFEKLRIQTKLGNVIIKRLQLERKCEDIVRTHVEGAVTDEFVSKMLSIQQEKESQIILMSDMYITLRSLNTYKRPYPHKTAIDLLEKEFKRYFDGNIYDRFIKFQDEFETLYNEF